MYYEITVSKNGKHFFTTSSHSLLSEEVAKEVYQEFLKRFPKQEGFKVTCLEWLNTGIIIHF